MSDGPHRSLPMRRSWKRVAECADNRAFDAIEIQQAIGAALEQDCRGEMSRDFLDRMSRICRDEENSLFKGQARPKLEALRPEAGPGIGHVILDHAIRLAANGTAAGEIPMEATKRGLIDRGARCARQVDEHYCRKSTQARAYKVRERVEQGLKGSHLDSVARRVLNGEPGKSSRQPTRKQGLDDGVKLG